VATNLRFFELGADVRSLIVTSPQAGEGKTTLTLGVARALAAAGERVIAIEADLRRPTFATYGLNQSVGLSNVLIGRARFSEVLVEVDAVSFQPTGGNAGATGTFQVVPSGPVPPNPQALLARPVMREVISEACAMADVVLIDAPPIGTVNDAVTLARQVDGVVMVARLNQTNRDAAARAVRTLQSVDARVFGVVATDSKVAPDGYYGDSSAGRPAPEQAALKS
jgi:capsular exopolysaccharide synthesis family protein